MLKYDVIQAHNNKLLLLPSLTISNDTKDKVLDLFTVERLLRVDLDVIQVSENYTYAKPPARSDSVSSTDSSDTSVFSDVSSDRHDSITSCTSCCGRSDSISSVESEIIPSDIEDKQKRVIQSHITGKSKRQRVGPSCDMCQTKKIKCDAYIEVLKPRFTGKEVPKDSDYLSEEDIQEGYKLILSNNKLIKFRNCSSCESKGVEASFKRGYTKEDIADYNLTHHIVSKKPKRRRR